MDDWPLDLPLFEPESQELGRYCQEQTQLFMSGSRASDAERVLRDRLAEWVNDYADRLKMPRWLRTREGLLARDSFSPAGTFTVSD